MRNKQQSSINSCVKESSLLNSDDLLNESAKRHTCLDCDVSYVHSYFLDEHRRSHYCKGRRMRCWGNLGEEQQRNNGTCPLCGVKFSQAYNLKRHMILHKFYQLKSSDLNVTTNETLDEMQKKKLELVKECNGVDNTECLSSFISSNFNHNEDADRERVSNEESALYSGLWSKAKKSGSENDIGKVSGENLGFKYSIEGVVYKSKEEHVECDTCKKKFDNKQLLETHMKLVHLEKVKPLVCNHCSKTFSLLIHLVYHAKRDHNVKMSDGKNYYLATAKDLKNKPFPTDIAFKVFACKECPKVYPTLRQLQDHLVKNHVNAKPRTTKIVHKDKKKRGLTRIRKVDKKYPCPDCEKVCLSYGGLRAHLASHSDAPPSICDVCGKSFKERHALLTHVKIHNAPKYICDQCGSMHKAIGNLTRHMLLHSDIKMYKCNICDKSFRLYDNMKYHIQTHTGEKPYCCDVCNCRFREKRAWMKHVNNHRDIKPFKCPSDLCSREFVDRKHLNKHMLEHSTMMYNENN